uniref:RecQ mediated genome instability protein 1-like N-terminal helical domain-containing protein n=3 Tax=Parascaris univalens TaxID=6257 RepID=A0A915BSN0_PARUN
MNIMERDLVESFFAHRHIILNDEWFDEVLKYLRNELNSSKNETTASLCDQVFEQWLFSDLCSSTRPVLRLPPYSKKIVLKDRCTLQVDWIVDISRSAYSQFRLLREHFTDNSGFDCDAVDDNHSERKSSQFLVMEVTDGQRKLRAISIGDIAGLSVNSTPGTKIHLIADVVCRRNILTLTPFNTQILGGDVDTLVDRNTPVDIIVRRLNIDESRLQMIERVEKSVMNADEEPEKKEIMEVEGADMPVAVEKDTEGNQSGELARNERIIDDVVKKLRKSEEMSAECGAKTVAIGDCAGDKVDTTTLRTESECVENMTDEVAEATIVPMKPTVRKTAEREDFERSSTLKLQNGITLKIIPHKEPQMGNEIVEVKRNDAKEDSGNQLIGWNKRTLDEATIKEIDLKLKRIANNKYKGRPVGMRTITAYYAPVRRLRESESGKSKTSYESLLVEADSARKMEAVDTDSRSPSFQAASNDNSNGPCVSKDPHPRCQVPAAEGGLSHCRQAPELENSGQRSYDQVPKLEYVNRLTCGQMRAVESADRPTSDKILELKDRTHPSCRQLPTSADTNRHDVRQEPLLENVDSVADRRLERFNERDANISGVFQKASDLHNTLPFAASYEQLADHISRGSFIEKLDRMVEKKADTTHVTNIESRATISENMLKSNPPQSSSIKLSLQRKEHAHSATRIYRMRINNKECRRGSSGSARWNTSRNRTNETIYSMKHNDSGIIPSIYETKRGDISPTSKAIRILNASFAKASYTDTELNIMAPQRTDARGNTLSTYTYKNDGYRLDEVKTSKKHEALNAVQPSVSSFGMKPPSTTEERNDDVSDAENHKERSSVLDSGNPLITPSTSRPINEVQPPQIVLKTDQPVAVVDERLSLTPRKRRLNEYCSSNDIVPYKTSSRRYSHENERSVTGTDGKDIDVSSSASHSITLSRPFTLFDVQASSAERSASSDYTIIRRFQRFRIMTLADVHRSRRFWMIPQRKKVQPINCEVVGSLQVSNDGWMVSVLVSDHTARDLFCNVENDTLERLLGFSFKDCKRLFATKERQKLLQYKRRTTNVLQLFTRLDLLLTIEFSPSFDIIPLIVDITNLAGALGIC